jgi:hypothetical protein
MRAEGFAGRVNGGFARRVCAYAVGGLFGCLAVWLAVGSASAWAATTTFTTQGCGAAVGNVFTVPAGVTSVRITATGSAGQTFEQNIPAGTGDVVSGMLSGPQLPGQILDVCVDWGGGPGGSGPGGSGPGGNGGGAGGGASGVALDPAFSTPVLIAGGGGGNGLGGNSGGGAGLPSGGNGGSSFGGSGGGGGGTQSTGGTGGAAEPSGCGGETCTAGLAGVRFSVAGSVGGAGGSVSGGCCGAAGGGGGAGYFGGGGAGGGGLSAPVASGGGGSDFCASTLGSCMVTDQNSSFGTASVTISYTSPLPTSKAQCQHGGWKTFTDINDTPLFKSQGDCMSFVNTGGKNPPAGPSPRRT